MNEVKSCPFCGHVGLSFDEGSTFRWLAYSCSGCGMGSETRVQTMGEGNPEQWLDIAKQHAIAEWNHRSPQAQEVAASDARDAGRWRALNEANDGQAMFAEHVDVSFRLPKSMHELDWDIPPRLDEIADALASQAKE